MNRIHLLIAFSFILQSTFAQELIPFNLGDKYGFKDKKSGNIVINPIYDRVAPFSEDLAYAERQGKKYFINKSNE